MSRCLRTGSEIGSAAWKREPLPNGGFCCINCEVYFQSQKAEETKSQERSLLAKIAHDWRELLKCKISYGEDITFHNDSRGRRDIDVTWPAWVNLSVSLSKSLKYAEECTEEFESLKKLLVNHNICADDEKEQASNKVLREIAAERKRQIEQEGMTTNRDDHYTDGSLAAAAASYAWLASLNENSDYSRAIHLEMMRGTRRIPHGVFSVLKSIWPASWSIEWLKPKNPRRDLIRAAALIVAEIERLDRMETNEKES